MVCSYTAVASEKVALGMMTVGFRQSLDPYCTEYFLFFFFGGINHEIMGSLLQ